MRILFIFILFFSKLSLASTDCDQVFENLDIIIPKEARIIHIPQLHYAGDTSNIYPKEYVEFEQEVTIKSQLSLAKTIMDYPNEIHVSEGIMDMLEGDPKKTGIRVSGDAPSLDQKIVESSMDSDFYKKSYDELTKKEKLLIYKSSVSLLLFFSGNLKAVYPEIENEKDFKKIMKGIKDVKRDIDDISNSIKHHRKNYEKVVELEMEKLKLYNKQTFLTKSQREYGLKEQVNSLSSKYPDKRIFFNYGMAHDFAYLFKEPSFYRLPNSLTVPERYLSHPEHALLLLRSTITKYSLSKEREEVTPEISLKNMIKDTQEAFDIIMKYVQNKGEKDIGMFCTIENKYLTDDELLWKAHSALKLKHQLQKDLNGQSKDNPKPSLINVPS